MDLNFTAEEQAFRDEVRAFLRGHVPEATRNKILAGLSATPDDIRAWQRALHKKGWGAPGWPKAFGGTGWNAIQRFIFDEECAAYGAPQQLAFGVKMVAPVIMAFGTPEQQQRYLPGIISGEVWWCQGYSEPGAGSDLASLKTRAVRDGDHYVINGQKTWTTLGQYADWMFCLVRTDPEAKAQRGISFLLVDMKTPGITVRPIITLDGAHDVNEVLLEDVRVPVTNLVGEENKGWTCAKFLLGHERAGIAGIGNSKRNLTRLKRIAASESLNGRPLLEDPLFAARLAQVEIDLMALEITNLRVLASRGREARAGSGGVDPQDQGHRDHAGDHRADDAGGGRVCIAVRPRGDEPGLRRRTRRSRLCGAARGHLLQHAQGHDLRRLQRDPEEHRRADDSRTVSRP